MGTKVAWPTCLYPPKPSPMNLPYHKSEPFPAVARVALLLPCLGCATQELLAAESADYTLDHPEPGMMQLRIEHLPLAQALAHLARDLGLHLNAKGLAPEPVSVRCNGPDAASLLDCLLVPRYSYVIRPLGATRELRLLAQAPGSAVEPLPSQQTRADHLARLTDGRMTDAPAVQAELMRGLFDPSPLVRAQAVSGLSRHFPEQASLALARGLRDDDASVRLIAVENATDTPVDRQTLQFARLDQDDTVRTLAALKLETTPDDAESRAQPASR